MNNSLKYKSKFKLSEAPEDVRVTTRYWELPFVIGPNMDLL